MKNKILKSVVCIASGAGIATLIPFTTTSCGCSSSEKIIPLPESVYDIDQNNVLKGFTSEFLANPTVYNRYNTMQIPASVKSIANKAFHSGTDSTIPDFITKLTFAEGSVCSTIGWNTFAWGDSLTSITLPSCLTTLGGGAFLECSSFTSITLPSSLTKIDNSCFNACSKLNNIEWNLPTNYQSSITIVDYAFNGISSTGSVKSLNTSIASSQQLFDWIKDKGRFPSAGWGPANYLLN